jgi:hypothetical protein
MRQALIFRQEQQTILIRRKGTWHEQTGIRRHIRNGIYSPVIVAMGSHVMNGTNSVSRSHPQRQAASRFMRQKQSPVFRTNRTKRHSRRRHCRTLFFSS